MSYIATKLAATPKIASPTSPGRNFLKVNDPKHHQKTPSGKKCNGRCGTKKWDLCPTPCRIKPPAQDINSLFPGDPRPTSESYLKCTPGMQRRCTSPCDPNKVCLKPTPGEASKRPNAQKHQGKVSSDSTSDVPHVRPSPPAPPPSLKTPEIVQLQDVENYLDHLGPRLEPRTLQGYKQDLQRVFHMNLGNWPESYVQVRSLQGVSKRTINLEVQTWNAFLKWLGRPIPPWKPLRHVPQKVRRALTSEEVDKLLEWSGLRADLWRAYLLTGARKSELLALHQEDIDLERGTLTLRDAKRKERVRVLPLHPEARPIFVHWMYVLDSAPSNLLRAFKLDCKRAGLPPDLDIHCLRVTFVTNLIRAGAHIQAVQLLAGHSNIRTTLTHYLKTPNGDLEKALNLITLGRGEGSQLNGPQPGNPTLSPGVAKPQKGDLEMNQTIELLKRTRELLLDLQVELTKQSLESKPNPRPPRRRTIMHKINGGGK